jgi:segregation and condensation protein B
MTESDIEVNENQESETAFEAVSYQLKEIDACLLRQIIEGLLLAAGRPLSVSAIAELFLEAERPDADSIKAALDEIANHCDARGFELKEVASGFRFQVRQHLSPWISRLSEERPQRYTRALLETLGLIAYRQPITRGDIEEIRGVAVSSTIIRTLLDREWVRIVGHRDVPGRPAMFATTRQFLDYFNLKSLQQLPPLAEIRDLDQLMPQLDLGDGTEGRVLVLPDEESEINLNADDSDIDQEQLLNEDEAMALARRPLDEILGYNRDKTASVAIAKKDDGQTTQGEDPMQDSKHDR